MIPYVKKFIEENIKLIRDNEWSKLYSQLLSSFIPYNTGNFTQTMIDANIDPLLYLNSIPTWYFNKVNTYQEKFKIPSNISILSMGSFLESTFTQIETTPNIFYIGSYAFKNSDKLKELIIHRGLKQLNSNAFAYCKSLTSLTFLGTAEQWEKINKDNDWNHNSYISKIHCTDKIIEL